jgi:hypothetical protein
MANNTLIGAIRAEATLESGKFVDGAKKIRTETKKTEAVVKSSFSGMGAAVKGFGGALTAGLSIGLLGGIAKKALDFAAAIGTTAKQLGVGTKELQLFRHAADQVGVKQAEADKGLERLGITLGRAAAGSATATKALAAVGITLQDIATKSRTEIFAKMADQMNKQGGAAKNVAAGNAVMQESFNKLIPLFDKGSLGINELSAAAERLGIVLSDRQIQQADETAQKLDDVRAVLSAQIAGVVADNAASIVGLANALASLTSSIINFLGSNPQAALGILGALAGSRFGLPGAAAGGIAGLYAGSKVAAGSRDANMDPRFRAQQIRKAQTEYRRTKTLYGGGPAGSTDRARAAKELQRQIDLGRKAEAAARSRSTAPGTAAIPQFLAPAPKTTRKRTPRTRQGPRDRSDDVEFQFEQELRRAQMDILRAQQQLAGTSDERTRLALALLASEKEMQDAELKNRVRVAERDFAEGKITESALQQVKANAKILEQKNEESYKLQERAILQDRELQRMERAEELSQQTYEQQLDGLRFADEMALNREEHRSLQLQIVDTLYKQKEAHLRALKAQLEFAGKIEEAADVQAQIDRLPTERARDQQRAVRSTSSPMESWKAEFGDITDELEDLKVRGIMGAVDALGALTGGFDDFAEAAKNAIAQVIAELIRLQLMKLAVSLIGGASGSSIGMVSGSGTLPPLPPIPGLAGGGSFNILGRGGVDRNLLSMNGLPIARVSRGEKLTVQPANGNGMGVTVHAPITIQGNATRETIDQAASTIRRRVATVARKGYG